MSRDFSTKVLIRKYSCPVAKDFFSFFCLVIQSKNSRKASATNRDAEDFFFGYSFEKGGDDVFLFVRDVASL